MARATDPVRARDAATRIVRGLREHGHVAYFAGGCVRDGLLGLHPTDFDIATDAPPQKVSRVFPRTAQVGAAFGVVLVHIDLGDGGGLVSVEVATFRSDGPYTDARRPDAVTFSDPESDAQRRDFTINALFLDPLAAPEGGAGGMGAGDLQGRVIDYVGGVEDLQRRVVRAVGDPDKRLAEDHLRALRAVRFAARLGFALDDTTGAAIARHANELRGVSRERIGEEIRRMLGHPARARAVELLQALTLDAPVLNEQTVLAPTRLVGGLPVGAEVMTVLAAWATDRSSVAGSQTGKDLVWLSDVQVPEIIRRLRGALMLSNDESEELGEILRSIWAITQRWGGMRVSQRKRLAGKSCFGKSLQVVRAGEPGVADEVEVAVAGLASDGVGVNPPVLVTGDDLIADGMKPGPRFKGILDEVRDAQLEGKVRGQGEAMELARRLGV